MSPLVWFFLVMVSAFVLGLLCLRHERHSNWAEASKLLAAAISILVIAFGCIELSPYLKSQPASLAELEKVRTELETVRTNAEKTRLELEKEHLNVEKLRSEAEAARADLKKVRADSEAVRVKVEKLRASSSKALKQFGQTLTKVRQELASQRKTLASVLTSLKAKACECCQGSTCTKNPDQSCCKGTKEYACCRCRSETPVVKPPACPPKVETRTPIYTPVTSYEWVTYEYRYNVGCRRICVEYRTCLVPRTVYVRVQ